MIKYYHTVQKIIFKKGQIPTTVNTPLVQQLQDNVIHLIQTFP